MLTRTRDQVCFPLIKLNQVREVFSMGQQEYSKLYGGCLLFKGEIVLAKHLILPFFTNINWVVFRNSLFFYESFVNQNFMELERTNNRRLGLSFKAERLQIQESQLATEVSPEVGGGSHRD